MVLTSYKCLNTNKLDTKNGIQGIFNRESAPKLGVESPTENAKNKANNTEKSKSGFCQIYLKKPKNFKRNIRPKVRKNI